MSRILVPVDFSAQSVQAVRFALEFAKNTHELTLLHVIPPIPSRNIVSRIGQKNVEEFQMEEAKEELKKFLAMVEDAQIPHSVEIRFGEAHEVIAEYAKQGYEAIVMGTHGYGRVTGMLLHSVSYPTLHDAQIPVFLIAEETDVKCFDWKKVLIAVDGSQQATEAAHKAIQLSGERDVYYTLLTVVPPPVSYAGPYGVAWEDASTLEGWGRDTLRPYEELFQERQKRYESKVLIGDAATLIKETAREKEVDLIVLGHHGMGAIAGTLMGSVTFKIVHGARTPLLIVKSTVSPK